jgi:hypothetical protein
MSILDTLKADGTDILSFLKKVKDDVVKVKNLWVAINSPQTRAFVTTLAQHVLKTIADADAAVMADGLNFKLDAELLADAKLLIADAKAGDGVLKTDLAILGITL